MLNLIVHYEIQHARHYKLLLDYFEVKKEENLNDGLPQYKKVVYQKYCINIIKIQDERKKIRKSKRYQDWRMEVFKNADFKCENCGKKGYLEAHHIKLFSEFIDGRFDVKNGQALCKNCHLEVHFE